MPEPQLAGGPQGQTPPMGQSPAVGATANRGFEAQGMQQIVAAIKLLERAIPMVGAVSEIGKDVMKSITGLSKHIPEGAVSPAAERNVHEQAMLRNAQNQQMAQQLRQQPGAAPGGPPKPDMGMAA